MEGNNKLETPNIQTADDYEVQSELNDMKQHADKIIQGIKKLDNNDANRAIWELFQNAVDLSEECHINIKIKDSTFEFSHNGEPFTPMTLDCLFKQVSSKTLEEKKQLYFENDPVGQYGTGFITTHAFGKELTIDGALIKGEGFVGLNQFEINRNSDNWKELAGRIRDLKKEVSSLLNKGEVISTPYPKTTFTYKTATKHHHESAIKALASLRLILPYVMTLNPKLQTVSVTDLDGLETTYKKSESYSKGELRIRPIFINGTKQEICYLESESDKVTIILPLTSDFKAFQFDENLPRLFLFYPLIGTQQLGINFIIHSRQFQPTEPRNSLYLKSDNDSNEKDEATNRDLIRKASSIIFSFVKENASQIELPIKLATINFNTTSDNTHLNEYFNELKLNWINEFKNYPVVETDSGNIKPAETLFLHKELLLDDVSFEAVYNLAYQFWKNIPKKHFIKEWTNKIDEWNIEDIKYIQIKDIVAKIQESANLEVFEEEDNLKQFYLYLINQDKSVLFNEFKLLPNIKGEFRHWTGNEGLNNNLNLPEVLIEIAEVIMPDVPKRHVNPDFKFSLEFVDYSRRNFTTDINECITKKIAENSTSEGIDEAFLNKLLEYCKITPIGDSESVPTKMVNMISQYYKQSESPIVIPTIKEDLIDNRPAQEKALKMFLNDISNLNNDWIQENLEFLRDVISIGHNYSDYEKLFLTIKIFPNQLYELKEQNFLFIDDGIQDDIKNLYDKVTRPESPIRANLVHENFKGLLKNKQMKTTRELAEKIEGVFFDDHINWSIYNHPYKKEIVEIVEKLKVNREFEKYFKLIYSKRSSILVELADSEDTFSILCLDSNRISKLAKLGNNPNFDEIVKLGQEALLQKQKEGANFKHKYAIGTHIEAILKQNLKSTLPENIKAKIEDVQDGQDIIIIIDDKPLYFIEVKSRWDKDSSVRMSKNQTLRADKEKNNYSLCTFDMTKYEGEDRFKVEDIEKVKHCIKFNNDIGVKVTHLIGILSQTNDLNTIHLDGDYKTLIPMKYIETGIGLDAFENYLITSLKD